MRALGLILGGTLGNLYDRVVYDGVRDFIDWHYHDLEWPVFNIADCCLVCERDPAPDAGLFQPPDPGNGDRIGRHSHKRRPVSPLLQYVEPRPAGSGQAERMSPPPSGLSRMRATVVEHCRELTISRDE